MTEYVIEKGVPIPDGYQRTDGASKTSVIRTMVVGDSFMLEGAQPGEKAVYTWRNTARNVGAKVAIRKVDGGCRVWRTA